MSISIHFSIPMLSLQPNLPKLLKIKICIKKLKFVSSYQSSNIVSRCYVHPLDHRTLDPLYNAVILPQSTAVQNILIRRRQLLCGDINHRFVTLSVMD